MKKADVIAEISEKTGIDKADVTQSLETFFSVVKGSLSDEEQTYVRGFGVLFTKKARIPNHLSVPDSVVYAALRQTNGRNPEQHRLLSQRFGHLLRCAPSASVKRIASANPVSVLQKKSIEEVAGCLGVTPSEIIRILQLLHTSSRNSQPIVTDSLSTWLIRLKKLADYGISIFQNQANFIQWLHRPLPLLNNQSPLDRLYAADGLQQIDDILGRIEAGVYS